MRQVCDGFGRVDGSLLDQGVYTIGELAVQCGVSPRAIRFYEEQGLIAPRRAGANRIYDRRDRGRLQLVLRGKRLGFSLADIRRFLDLYDADRTGARQMALTLDRTRGRIQELEAQLQDIQLTLGELREIEAEVLAAQAGTDPSAARPRQRDVVDATTRAAGMAAGAAPSDTTTTTTDTTSDATATDTAAHGGA